MTLMLLSLVLFQLLAVLSFSTYLNLQPVNGFATKQAEEPSVYPVSVFVLPRMEGKKKKAFVKHFFDDGLAQSSVLRNAESNLDENLVWIVNTPDASELASKISPTTVLERRPGESLWCTQLLENAKQTQIDRSQAGLSTTWPIHFVDNKDNCNILRCKPVEHLMGSVQYHQRCVVMDRQFQSTEKWVKLGKKMRPNGIPFQHKPIGVRTDIVQAIEDVLTARSSSISDSIASFPRDLDVAYFWEPAAYEKKKSPLSLRDVVFYTLQDMQKERSEYKFSLGLTGDAGPQGRKGVSTSYIQALLNSKIVVLAQRDKWEDHYRLMEALVAGPLVMTDKMLSLPEGLQDGISIVEYSSAKDLASKAEYYLDHDEERIEIACRGRQVAMSRYRSWHQLEKIIFGKQVTTCSGSSCMATNATKHI